MIEVDVRVAQGTFALDARFATSAAVTALFGRSGSGKTTLVGCIAGLRRPTEGRITVGGRVLFDSAAGIDVPRHRRRVGYVFQDARLFPHLTVRRNLLYGRWLAPRAERGAAAALDEAVALLGIGHLLARRPGTLSGGERQRVAIGRALLASPRLLLMDEPLASLDEARKAEILPHLDRLRRESRVPIVYVSHAVDEVARLAETVVLLEAGHVAAAGPLAEVLAGHELGAAGGRAERGSILEGRVTGRDEAYGLTRIGVAGQTLAVASAPGGLGVGAAVRLRVPARDVALARGGADLAGLSIRNQLKGRIVSLEAPAGGGPLVRADVDIGGGQLLRASLTRLAADELALAPGVEVVGLIRVAAVEPGLVLPAAGGAARP